MASIEVEIEVICESCGRPLGHEIIQSPQKGLVTIKAEACSDCISEARAEVREEAEG